MKRRLSILASMVLVLAGLALADCSSMLARGLRALTADPRQQNHAYYAKIDFSFDIGGIPVSAARFADVYYLSGGDPKDYRFPPCDATKPNCWKQTDHFFFGLPNSDIIEVVVSYLPASLPTLSPLPVISDARISAVFRDQPGSKLADEYGPCLNLSVTDLAADYNIPIKYDQPLNGPYSDFSGFKVKATIQRLEKLPHGARVLSKMDFLKNEIFDKYSCGDLIQKYQIN